MHSESESKNQINNGFILVAANLVFLLVCSFYSVSQTTWYVDDNNLTGNSWVTSYDADGANDESGCGTIGNPCRTIQYTIDENFVDGDTIAIDVGNYSDNDVQPFFGEVDLNFKGAGESLVTIDAPTGSTPTFHFIDDGSISFKNLTINGANITSGANDGGAINVSNSGASNISLTLKNVTLSSNVVNNGASLGGAVLVSASGAGDVNVNIDKCTFSNNSTIDRGGGIF